MDLDILSLMFYFEF